MSISGHPFRLESDIERSLAAPVRAIADERHGREHGYEATRAARL
jgi:hypothetical protein